MKIISLITLSALLFSLAGCDHIALAHTGASYAAKQICTNLFVNKMELDTIKEKLVGPVVFPLLELSSIEVDQTPGQESVSVSVNYPSDEGLSLRTAVYRSGLGCTALTTLTEKQLRAQPFKAHQAPYQNIQAPWPAGSAKSPSPLNSTDTLALKAIIDLQFAESKELEFDRKQLIVKDSKNRKPKNTMAVLVIHKGKLIAEQYAVGYGPHNSFMTYSMSKTVTALLIGTQVDRGNLKLDGPAPVKAWQGTSKETISLRQLLNFSDGLDWSEDYKKPTSHITHMLFNTADMGEYVASIPAKHQPGTVFNYATGVTSLLSALFKQVNSNSLQASYSAAQNNLFTPIGIRSAQFEVDESGTMVGGVYASLSAQDWARLGQLVLQQGQWRNKQIISKEWMAFMRTPSKPKPNYGGQLWLWEESWGEKGLAKNVVRFAGRHSNNIFIMPDQELVILRLGQDMDENMGNQDALATAAAIAQIVGTPEK